MLAFYLSLLESDSDRLIFAQIYELYERKMYGTAKNILRSHEKAEDAVHDSFLKVIKDFETCRGLSDDALPKWLITITKRTALDMLKKKANDNVSYDDLFDPDTDVAADSIEDNISLDELMDKIRNLPDNYREIIELKLVLERSDKEIAKVLGLNENTVRSRIMRGKALLRQSLAPQEC